MLKLTQALRIMKNTITAPFTASFNFSIDTTLGTGNTFTLPLIISGTYDFDVDWGDGSSDTITVYNAAARTHTYASGGVYHIKITGQCWGWQFNNSSSARKVTNIAQWGNNFRLIGSNTSITSLFLGCRNMKISATNRETNTSLGLVNATSLFKDNYEFEGPLTALKGAGLTNMSNMLNNCFKFNSSIKSLNTAGVQDMSQAFDNCREFNKPVDTLDTSSVTTMNGMLSACLEFNQSLVLLDTALVTNMANLLTNCPMYNQPLNVGETWLNTSSVTTMQNMLRGCISFNQSVAGLDVSNVEDMSFMFADCVSFDQPLSTWDVSKVQTFEEMLSGCLKFNSSIANLNTSSAITMAGMFAQCELFDQPVSHFNTSSVEYFDSMFYGCSNFDQDVSMWDISSLVSAYEFLEGSSFSTQNYNLLLVGWEAQDTSDVLLSMGNVKYSRGAPEAARDAMISRGWIIMDGGAEATPEQYFTFDSNTGAITDYDTNGGLNVVIPSTIDGVPVTAIGPFAFSNKGLVSIELPEGITTIDTSGLALNPGITSIQLPTTLTTLGINALDSASILSINLAHVTSMLEGCLRYTKLSYVEVPEVITSLRNAFYFCPLTYIYLGANVDISGDEFGMGTHDAEYAFKTVYDGNGKQAGGYLWMGGPTWILL
jgi:surface protein